MAIDFVKKGIIEPAHIVACKIIYCPGRGFGS
jgi:hypothetical protein